LICPRCQAEVGEEKKFCTSCGFDIFTFLEKVKGKKMAAPAPQPAPPAPGMPQPRARLQQAAAPARTGFVHDVLLYPFQGSGPVIIIFGTVMLVLLRFLMFLGFLGIIIGVFVMGYLALYYFNVIRSSSSNSNTPPDWPDISGGGDLFSGWFMFFIISLISTLPLILYPVVFGLGEGEKPNVLYALLLLSWGGIYFPMASIIAAEARNIIALNPITVMIFVSRAPAKYYLVCLVVWLIACPMFIINQLGAAYLGKSAALIIIAAVVDLMTMYTMMAVGRTLGLFYKELIPGGA